MDNSVTRLYTTTARHKYIVLPDAMEFKKNKSKEQIDAG